MRGSGRVTKIQDTIPTFALKGGGGRGLSRGIHFKLDPPNTKQKYRPLNPEV